MAKKPQMGADGHGLDKTMKQAEDTAVGFESLVGLFEQTHVACKLMQAVPSIALWLLGIGCMVGIYLNTKSRAMTDRKSTAKGLWKSYQKRLHLSLARGFPGAH